MIRRFRDFDIQLNIKNDKFIAPPRKAQRRWLLGKAVDELSQDLTHLNEVAKIFVPGSEYAAIKDRSNIELNEQQVMEDWQYPLMKVMANIVTQDHGNLLEVGFGRGVSAEYIQQQGVESHTIIECNEHIVKSFYEPWRNRYPDRNIRMIHAMWQDATDQLDTYDSIFFHTYAIAKRNTSIRRPKA
jgi:guanidinoacetate N-methyltransferase